MQLTSIRNQEFSLKQKNITSERKKNALLLASTAAIVSPFLSIIDGDSFKETYKNRNVVKYATGLSAVLGTFVATKILTDEYIEKSIVPKKYKMIRDTVLGAMVLPLLLLVENWAQVDKNKKNLRKFYPLALVIGGVVGLVASKIDQNKKV